MKHKTFALLRFFIVALTIYYTLSISAVHADDYTIPPDVAGDLDGTAEADSFYIQNTGTVDGNVNGKGGSNSILIEAGGTVGASATGGEGTDDNSIINSGTVTNLIYGSSNTVASQSGGSNEITNSGSVGQLIYGSYNKGDTSSGGNNVITNSGTVGLHIYGSENQAANTSGGGNIIDNTSSGVVITIRGSSNSNLGNSNSGGSNIITNSGTVLDSIYGSDNAGANSLGGDNTITNTSSGNVQQIYGSRNEYNSADGSDRSSGGNNRITNAGDVANVIRGSENTGTYSSGGSNTITNSGTVGDIYGSYNFGANSSGGSNIITNSGTVSNNLYGSLNLGADSSSTGNTIINSGTIGGSIYGSSNTGAGSSGGNDSITNSGTVDGSIFGEDGNDTVIMQNGPESVGGNIDGGDGSDTIVYSGGIWTSNNSKIINFEDMAINATGNLTLSGAWDIGGGTASVNGGNLNVADSFTAGGLAVNSGTVDITGTVNSDSTNLDGQMHLDGNLYSPTIDINSSGFLWGIGTMHGDVVNNATISPGNSIGTMTINGSYTHDSDATYIVEVDANGNSDLLDVSGTATLNGGTVETSLPRELYTDGYDWDILQADGGINGSFNMVSGQPDSATLALDIAYLPTTASLFVERTPYASFGLTENEQNIGNSLDAIVPLAAGSGSAMEQLLISLDFDYSAEQISQLLDTINPEMYTAFTTAARQNSYLFSGSIRRRTAQASESAKLGSGIESNAGEKPSGDTVSPGSDSTDDHNWQVWSRVYGSKTERQEKAMHEGYELSSSSIVIGGDGKVYPNIRTGFALNVSQTDLDFNDNDSGTQKSMLTGIYTAAEINNFHTDFSLSVGWHNNESERIISSPSSSQNVSSEFDSTTLQLHAGGDYFFRADNWLFGPTIGLDYFSISTDGFSENSGSILDLTVDDSNGDHFVSRLGMKGTTKMTVGGIHFVPGAELAWLHSFSDEENDHTAFFKNYSGTPFTVSGAGVPEDILAVEAGLTARVSEQVSATLEAGANLGDNFSDYLVSIGIEWKF